jgi:hypothetical protein
MAGAVVAERVRPVFLAERVRPVFLIFSFVATSQCTLYRSDPDHATGFTGDITGEVCGKETIKKAIKAYEFYKKYVTYPADRERQLKAALGVAPKEIGIKVVIRAFGTEA